MNFTAEQRAIAAKRGVPVESWNVPADVVVEPRWTPDQLARQAERGRARSGASGVVAQFDPESGVMLVPGDPGWNPNLSTPAPRPFAGDRLLDDAALTDLWRRSQAMPSVKECETHRHARLVAAAKGTAMPGVASGDSDWTEFVKAPGADKFMVLPRDTMLRRVGGAPHKPVFGPGEGLADVQARAERAELAKVARNIEALARLAGTSESARGRAADPGRPTPMFHWNP